MNYYKISEDELVGLLTAYHRLTALDECGVNNWSWYGENFNEYLKECLKPDITKKFKTEEELDEFIEYYTFEDLAREELENYQKI